MKEPDQYTSDYESKKNCYDRCGRRCHGKREHCAYLGAEGGDQLERFLGQGTA